MIMRPVEDVLGSVRGLKSMYSRCSDDGGFISMKFAWETDLHLARVEVWEKLDRIRRELPEDMEDITVSDDYHSSQEADDPVMEGRLSFRTGEALSYEVLERKIIRPLQ